MNDINEFILYEELMSFTHLESDEMLAKMNMKLEDLSMSYRDLEFLQNPEKPDELNEYQVSIIFLYNLLKDLWIWRN